MALFDIVMIVMLFAGLIAATVCGAIAAARRRAIWLLLSSVSLTIGSIPLLLGGIGVFGIAVATILLGAARSMPGYDEIRWGARGFGLLGLATVLYLQYAGAQRGNTPSTVDWILVGLAAVMFAITLAPVKPFRKAAPQGNE